MARISHGIMGHVSGKVGPLVFSSWRKIEYVRSLGKTPRRAESTSQQLQRSRFKLVSQFLASLSGLLEFSFPEYRPKQTPVNRAFSYNVQHGLSLEGRKPQLNFPKVLVACGKLQGAEDARAQTTGGVVEFTWTDELEMHNANRSDRLILVVYCPSISKCIWAITTFQRSDEYAQIDVAPFEGREVHTWMAFVREDLKDASRSMYTGCFTIEGDKMEDSDDDRW